MNNESLKTYIAQKLNTKPDMLQQAEFKKSSEGKTALNKHMLTVGLTVLSRSIEDSMPDETEDDMIKSEIAARVARDEFLTKVFKHEAFSFFSGDFIIYANTMEEVEDVKSIAHKLGYLNIRTYIPQVSDGTKFGSKPDPERAFAVSIKESEESLIGAHAVKLNNIFKPVVKDLGNIIHTRCYNGVHQLTFSNEVSAYAALALTQTLCEKINQEDRATMNLETSIRQDGLDNWIVRTEFVSLQ